MLALGLSMLWEQSVDPEAALRERFGFAGLDAVEAWVSLALARTWEITVDSCSRVVISDHNAIVWVHGDQGTLVVKWSRARERFSNLEASARLLRTVAEHGIPVAAPIATVDGLDRVSLDGPVGPLSVTVLPELPGGRFRERSASNGWTSATIRRCDRLERASQRFTECFAQYRTTTCHRWPHRRRYRNASRSG